MPVHGYTGWNKRKGDEEEQIEPFRKYCFICEGANTETFYFRRLIDLRKDLGIHPLIDVRLWEKTEEDKNISYAKNLFAFAQKQKKMKENSFDMDRDKMVIVFDADIFEEKVQGYQELIERIENENDIPAVTNPGFELFLLLHIKDSYDYYILGHEDEFLRRDEKGRYSHAYQTLLKITGINAKKNPQIGNLAENVFAAILQEKKINQDIHSCKGVITSNIGKVIESILKDKPEI